MQLTCKHCQRTIVYSGDRPSFCGYCGEMLADTQLEATGEYTPADSETQTRLASVAAKGRDEDAPPTVGGYRLVRRIGTGGMGTVYEAEEPATGRRVALKLVAPEYRTSQETLDRFRREGRLASMIAHPRCVFVQATDEDQGHPYIVMELMTGSTLMDLVRQQGPLPPTEAVKKILDVIEGLIEAHECGVIHRDVKPSNCFLEPDGRVKVGDFGLAKSLLIDGNLTKTGTFMGTLFFASPEQVRGESVDRQTDVYSVSATLYYLLTGKSPFQSSDAAATVARIVSDPLKPMRSIRPELPAALDKVVLRGLERDRKRRYKDLEELRAALLPFVPGRLSMGSMGLRFAAFLVDALVFAPLSILSDSGLLPALGLEQEALRVTLILGIAFLWVLYFGLMEGWLGWSLGKRLFRLRVCGQADNDAPGVGRGLLRALVFYAVMVLPWDVINITSDPDGWGKWWHPAVGPLCLAVMMLPMRARNGYRGVHEFASGTRVLRLPWGRKRRRLLSSTGWLLQFIRGRRFGQSTPAPEGLPGRIGSFALKGTLKAADGERVLLGEDATLDRRIWVWLRPAEATPIQRERQNLARTTRLRWLARGVHEGMQWDAFLAPAGCPLPALVASEGRLAWADARPILEQLADELALACTDGTLPRALSPDQVWVQATGRVQLVETSLADSPAFCSGSDQERCLGLLRETTILALEGKKRSSEDRSPHVRAPAPMHAADMLDRLLGEIGDPPPYGNVEELRADLAATHDRPTEVTTTIRGGHIGVLAAFLLLPVLFLFLLQRTHAAGLVSRLDSRIDAGEALLYVLGDDSLRKAFFQHLQTAADAPEPGQPPVPREAVELAERRPELLAQAVRDRLAQDQRELRTRVQRFDWLDRTAFDAIDPAAQFVLRGEGRRSIRPLEGQPAFSMLVTRVGVDGRTLVTHQLEPPDLLDALANARLIPALSLPSPELGLEFVTTVLIILLLAWMIWAFAFRGGISLWLVGVSLLRGDGRRAGRLQCAWRAFLVWFPFLALLWLTSYVTETMPDHGWLAHGLAWLSAALLAGYVLVALRYPDRAAHDKLAGTYLLPR